MPGGGGEAGLISIYVHCGADSALHYVKRHLLCGGRKGAHESKRERPKKQNHLHTATSDLFICDLMRHHLLWSD